MIDISELVAWADVLAAAGRDADDEGAKVVAKGSLNIKTDARGRAPHGPHTPAYAGSITYDLTKGSGWTEGEIGPIEGKPQRGLGNLFEYGNPYSPPQPHLEPALDAEEPRFYEQAEALAARLTERYG